MSLINIGAYHPYENERWKKLGSPGDAPVWDTKAESDQSYNEAMKLALRAIKARSVDVSSPDLAIILATHNEVSADMAVEQVGRLDLGTRQPDGSWLLNSFVSNRLAFAQLLGELSAFGQKRCGNA